MKKRQQIEPHGALQQFRFAPNRAEMLWFSDGTKLRFASLAIKQLGHGRTSTHFRTSVQGTIPVCPLIVTLTRPVATGIGLLNKLLVVIIATKLKASNAFLNLWRKKRHAAVAGRPGGRVM